MATTSEKPAGPISCDSFSEAKPVDISIRHNSTGTRYKERIRFIPDGGSATDLAPSIPFSGALTASVRLP